jgi:hypothetical protein
VSTSVTLSQPEELVPAAVDRVLRSREGKGTKGTGTKGTGIKGKGTKGKGVDCVALFETPAPTKGGKKSGVGGSGKSQGGIKGSGKGASAQPVSLFHFPSAHNFRERHL